MKKFLLASVFTLSLPLATFAQTNPIGSMSDPTTSANPSSSTEIGIAKAPASGGTLASPVTTSSSKTLNLSATDKTFINTAAIGGIAEVSDGQLAAQKGDSSIKQIGTQMVTDHTKANVQLATLSQSLGDPAPTQTDAMHMQTSATLRSKTGSAFDTAYLHTELLGHEKTIALFKKEVKSGNNPQLMAFAKTTLPILEGHLSMIESAQKS